MLGAFSSSEFHAYSIFEIPLPPKSSAIIFELIVTLSAPTGIVLCLSPVSNTTAGSVLSTLIVYVCFFTFFPSVVVSVISYTADFV